MEKISVIDMILLSFCSRYILQTRFYTTLQEFQKLIFVQSHGFGVYYAFLGQIVRDKYVILARVRPTSFPGSLKVGARHSQRVNDPPVQFSNQTHVSYFN